MPTFGIQKLVPIYFHSKKGIPWLTYKTVEILIDYVQLVTVPGKLLIVLYLRVYLLSVMRFRWAPNLKLFVVVAVLLRGRSMLAKTSCTFSSPFSYHRILFYYMFHEVKSKVALSTTSGALPKNIARFKMTIYVADVKRVILL